MEKEQTILEKALPMVRDLYASAGGGAIGKIQQNIAVGVIKGLIAAHNASKRLQKHIQGYTKSNGR